MPRSRGFTLIELLVVMAIIALVGTYTLSNYGSFGEEQKLKNAVLDVVSLLRQAQTNATTNVICTGGTWQVNFVDSTTINLKCSTSPNSKELKLNKIDPNISISSATGNSCPVIPFTSNFAPLHGNVNFLDSTSSYPNCVLLTITLTNTKNTKSLIIEQGGRIYAQ